MVEVVEFNSGDVMSVGIVHWLFPEKRKCYSGDMSSLRPRQWNWKIHIFRRNYYLEVLSFAFVTN